jgi:hypothetical protein
MLKYKNNGIVVLEDGLHHDSCQFSDEQITFLKKIEVEKDKLVTMAHGAGARVYKAAIKKRLGKLVMSL